jgi:WD40 repeat protein
MTKLLGALKTDLPGSVQDCQFNYYGNILAVCDSEGHIEIQHMGGTKEIGQAGEQGLKRQHCKPHDGPVWQVAWSEPSCGNLLAS